MEGPSPTHWALQIAAQVPGRALKEEKEYT